MTEVLIREGRRVKVYYEQNEKDDAPLAYFLHGAGGRSDQFRTLFALFKANYSMLSFDYVGHGSSEKELMPGDYYKTEEILEDIKEIYNKYKQNRQNKTIVISHSYGTALTTFLYQSMKEEIESIVLIGTCKNIPAIANHPILYLPAWVLEWMRPLMHRPFLQRAYHAKTRAENNELISYEELNTFNPMYIVKHTAWGMKWPTTEDFSKIDCPCLLLSGDADLITPISEIELVKECIPSAELVIISDSSHFPMLENIEETKTEVNKFLLKVGLPNIVREE